MKILTEALRKTVAVALLLTLALCLVFAARERADFQASMASRTDELKQVLRLSTVDVATENPLVEVKTERPFYSIQTKRIEYTMTNISDRNLTYGAPFRFEILLDGEWYDLGPNDAFILIGYYLLVGETEGGGVNIDLSRRLINWPYLPYNWLEEYGWLPGHYRIVKEIGLRHYAAEFYLR